MKKKIDISKLSKQEKLSLLDVIEERRRRRSLLGESYKPHDGQLKIHKSETNQRFLFCGNGFGKTAILVNECHWAATGYNPITKKHTPVPAQIVLLVDSPEKMDEVVIPEYRKWNPLEPGQLHKKGKPSTSQISYKNGSKLIVLSHAVEPLKTEGISMTHLFMDEPPPKSVFTSLRRGGRLKNRPLKILLAGTPLVSPWLRTDIFIPFTRGELKDVVCFRGNTYENKTNLEENYIESFKAILSEQEQRIRLHGDFFDLEGLALAHLWDRNSHVIEPEQLDWDKNYPCCVSIDPHPSKAHCAIMLGADKWDQLFVLKELTSKQTPRDFAKTLKEWMSGFRIVNVIVDSLGSSDMTGGEGFKSFIQVLREEGISARATTYNEKSDEDFIARIQNVLQKPLQKNNFGTIIPKLRVVSSCIGMISDIENCQWQKQKDFEGNKPKLEISNKDFLASLKYALATNLIVTSKRSRPYYLKEKRYGIDLRPKPKKLTFDLRKKLK